MTETSIDNRVNLDIVRIFAAFLVLTVHVGQAVGFNASIGAYGVQLFFVLSGYLICFSLEKNNLKVYIKKRVQRIIPTYWIVLILMYMWDVIRYSQSMPLAAVFKGPCSIHYLRYFLFLQLIIPSGDWGLWNNRNGLWTLSCFAVFYLLAPIVYRVFNKFWKSLFALFFLLLITPLLKIGIENALGGIFPDSAMLFSKHNPLTNLYCFFFGIVIYYSKKEKKMHWYSFVLFIILIITSGKWYFYEIVFTLLIMFMSLCAPLILNRNWQKKLAYVSERTYALYLCHPLVLQMMNIIAKKTGLENITYLNTILTFLAIFLSTYCIDAFIRLLVSKLTIFCKTKV